MRLLYYSPASYGGLADYAHEQANALASIGVDVEMLLPPDITKRADTAYCRRSILVPSPGSRRELYRRLHFIQRTLRNVQTLARYISESNHDCVLWGAFSEYLAPLWASKLGYCANRGVTFGSIVHDPVRDHVVGPMWWHRKSIADAFSFIREAFVHEPCHLDTVKPVPQLRVTVIPMGQPHLPPASQSRQMTREQFDLPAMATVLLAFGHVRDSKNLDLVLKAMRGFPAIYLVVAGREQSSGQRRLTYYQGIAERLGVAERCRWWNDYIPESKVSDLFEASDIVLLTYSRRFVSASSVLSVAVQFRRLCLASSGDGPLKAMVHKYGLGKWIEPDSAEAIEAGLQSLTQNPPTPDWDAFARENSWEANARIVAQRIFAYRTR